MSDAKHSPLPWGMHLRTSDRTLMVVSAGENLSVCNMTDYGGVPAVENAELICLAVNSYHDLVSALETLVADMDAEYRDGNGDTDHDGIEKAKAALRKAKGG